MGALQFPRDPRNGPMARSLPVRSPRRTKSAALVLLLGPCSLGLLGCSYLDLLPHSLLLRSLRKSHLDKDKPSHSRLHSRSSSRFYCAQIVLNFTCYSATLRVPRHPDISSSREIHRKSRYFVHGVCTRVCAVRHSPSPLFTLACIYSV